MARHTSLRWNVASPSGLETLIQQTSPVASDRLWVVASHLHHSITVSDGEHRGERAPSRLTGPRAPPSPPARRPTHQRALLVARAAAPSPRDPCLPCGTALRTGLLCGSTGQAGGRRTVQPGRRYARPKDARADALRLLWPHARREAEPGDRGHHRGGLEPGKGVFPSYRAHQARPGPLLPGRGRRRAARRGRAAERAQTVRERRWGRAVLPEA